MPRTHPLKGLKSEDEERYDRERYHYAFTNLGQLMEVVYNNCLEDEIMRDTVTIMLESFCEQLRAIERIHNAPSYPSSAS